MKETHQGVPFRSITRRNKHFAEGKTLAQAEFTSAGHVKYQRVQPPHGRRNPKRKTAKGCLFLESVNTFEAQAFRSVSKTKSQPSEAVAI